MTLATLEHAIFQHLVRFGRYPTRLRLGHADGVEIASELHRSGLEPWAHVTVDSLPRMSIMGLLVDVQAGFTGYELFD